MDFNGIATFTLESSVRKQALKVLEESAELFAAVDAPHPCKKDVLAEAADAVTAVANLLASLEVLQDEVDEAIGRCNARNAARGRIPAWVVRVGDGYVSDFDIDGYDNAHLEVSDDESMLFFDEDKACQFCEMLAEKLCMDAHVESGDTLKS